MSDMVETIEVSAEPPLFERAPHLLLVSAEASIMEETAEYMERQGIKVTTLDEPDSLLQVVQENPVDLIVMDYNLPDCDSLNLCQLIRQDKQTGYIPIIILIENPEKRERLAVQISGADDYMQKPVNERDLLLRVLALLRTKLHIDRLMMENDQHNRTIQTMLDEREEMQRRTNQVEILKQHIVNNVNHELRTPMLQIKSAVAMLVEIMQDVASDDKTQTISRMATQAVGRMEELIHNISQLQMIEQIKVTTLSLHDAVLQSLNILRRSWSHQNNMSRVEYIEPETRLYVLGDRRAIPRIIYLLVDNALKFSPDKISKVQITTHAIDEHHVKVSISDNGIGIPEEYHQQIFEAFFQVEPGTTRRFGGVGVGLSSAQALANQMGTSIKVESVPGTGSVFSFVLKRAPLDELDTA